MSAELERTTMYDTILVTLDGTPSDRAIIEHVKELAKLAGSRLVLLHVADGWAARTYGPDAVSPEIAEDTAYLQKVREEFQSAGISADAELAYGDPANEIVKWIEQKGCDLVAMSTHGHRFLADVFLGTTASRVQHRISVPVLLLRAR
jgi:nucleotide-binding universal stress UspA family protein